MARPVTLKSADADPAFWAKVCIIGAADCWVWSGAKKPKGYGNLTRNGKSSSAHRHAWLLEFGQIPKGMQVQHSCDNPSCCNPNHLMLGTVISNFVDMLKKGRSRTNHSNRMMGEQHPGAKLTSVQVQEIRDAYVPGLVRQVDIAAQYNVSQRAISLITRKEVRIHG